MIILAIETSCDDTCIAILKSKSQNPKSKINGANFEILSNIVSSQVKLHAKYGGVFPSLAKREHQRNLAPVLRKALEEARLLNPKSKIQNPKLNKILSRKIDLIAVTVGPGLEPCLWTGVNFAKALSDAWRKPIIPINHIEAHILVNFLSLSEEIKNLKTELPSMEAKVKKKTKSSSPLKIKNYFPAVCLVVSGGHTQLILMKGIGKYRILGETRDDAAGECFDKVARILGLGYPGGPAIAAAAAKFSISNSQFSIKLPRPMISTKDYDFSFSGLKTAVLYLVKNLKSEKKLTKKRIQEICFESQQSIIDVLIKKTMKAAKDFKAKSIVLGGGVAANEELRKQFELKIENLKFNFLVPPKNLCTDNAVMTATAAYFQWLKGNNKAQRKIAANANLRIS